MDIIILPSADDAVALTVRIIEEQVRRRPESVLGLATGATMEDVYRSLVRAHLEDGLDFSQVTTFNLDEYVGLTHEDPRSYAAYMRRNLFDAAGIDESRGRLPDGAAADLTAECRAFEEAIRAAGGIDLQLLGIGRSGHIGFNEPMASPASRTRRVVLAPETLKQNGSYFGGAEHMPRLALTMGIGTIMESRRCLLLATGKEKSAVLAEAVEGPVRAMIPASALQAHPACTVICDEPAAAGLRQRAYYDWLFQHDPAWARFRLTTAPPGSGCREG